LHPYIELFNIRIAVFSLFILFAASVCFLVYIINRKYTKGYIVLIIRFLFVALVGAAVGGRLLSALTLLHSSQDSFIHNIIYGGFVFYGGILGGLISLFIYCKKTKIPFLDICDVFASLMPIGQAIGRIGCYMNGCCYGFQNDGFLTISYVLNEDNIRVFPTWFFESGFCLLLAIFFQVFYRSSKSGMHTAVYFIAYSLFRFIIEFFRGDNVRGVYGWISTSQIISIFLFVVGIYIIHISCKQNVYNELLYPRDRETENEKYMR